MGHMSKRWFIFTSNAKNGKDKKENLKKIWINIVSVSNFGQKKDSLLDYLQMSGQLGLY